MHRRQARRIAWSDAGALPARVSDPADEADRRLRLRRPSLDGRPTTPRLSTAASSPGPTAWSQHAYGLAIDLNPVENPYVAGSGHVSPPAGRPYVDRARQRARDDPPPAASSSAPSARVGWEWGGNWSWPKDYQHFSADRHLSCRARSAAPVAAKPDRAAARSSCDLDHAGRPGRTRRASAGIEEAVAVHVLVDPLAPAARCASRRPPRSSARSTSTSRAWISMSADWPSKPLLGWWMRIAAVRQRHPLALRPRRPAAAIPSTSRSP